MIDPNHISPGESGSSSIYFKPLSRWIDYTWEKDYILPNLSADECLFEEDVIDAIRNLKND